MTARAAVARLTFAPLLAITAYAVVLAVRVPSLVHDTQSSDAVGPMLVADSLPSRHTGAAVVLGKTANYSTLWFDEATRGLSGHRAIWVAAPSVLALLGLLGLAEMVRRLAGWRAATIAVAVGIAMPPLLLGPTLTQASHNVTVANSIVLAALLVWLARTPRVTATHVLAGAGAIAVITGLDVASDPLLLVVGVAPFVAASLLLAARRRDRRALEVLSVAACVAIVALIAAGLTVAAMSHNGLSVAGSSRGIASPGGVRQHASLLGTLIPGLANGRLTFGDLGFLGPLRLLLGVVAVAGAMVPLWMLQHVARGVSPTYADDATTLFLAYWGFVALFLPITFLATTVPVDMSYLAPGFTAVAATVPFLMLRAPSTATTTAIAVTVSGVLGAVLLQHATLDDFSAQPQHHDAVVTLVGELKARGLHVGYAGYEQANLVTWQSDGTLTVRAVQQSTACHPSSSGWFCPYHIFTVADWYQPHNASAQQSFLVREVGSTFVAAPPPADLRPTSVFSVYPFEVYVYDHDIGVDAALHTAGWPGQGTDAVSWRR